MPSNRLKGLDRQGTPWGCRGAGIENEAVSEGNRRETAHPTGADRGSRTEGARLLRVPRSLVLLDGFLENAHNQCIQRGFVFFGPTRQLLMKYGRHANLE